MNLKDSYFNMPGRIVEYFPATQTATVKICVERSYSSANVDGELVTRGLLTDVPVHTSSGGGWALTHPIKEGDTCILFFSQIGYDHWLFKDEDEAGLFKGQPMFWTERKFDVQDGYALVGLNTIPRAIEGYNATDSEWRNAGRDQRIALKEDGHIHIKTGSTTIDLAPSGDITINTDTKLDATAPVVNVSCTTATVTAVTSVTLATPTTVVTGNLLVGGGVAVGVPAGGPVPAGLSVKGPSKLEGNTEVTGTMNSSGVITSTTDVVAGTVSLKAHVHANNGEPPVQ